MKSTPLFSVLIANHNDGKYLLDAINSVMAQTYNNWEIIIVDDYSIDNSKQLYNQYTNDPRFHIYFNEKNEGCGYTKRRCVELANGEICGFLDADDALAPDALGQVIEIHKKNPDASLVYSTYYLCDKDLNVQSLSEKNCSIPPDSSFLEFNRMSVSHFATFKKEKYLKTLGINPVFKKAEDVDIYLKLEEVGEIIFINKPLYYYRRGTGNNTSLGENGRMAQCWEVLARAEACVRRKLDPEKYAFNVFGQILDDELQHQFRILTENRSYKISNKISSIWKRLNRIRIVK